MTFKWQVAAVAAAAMVVVVVAIGKETQQLCSLISLSFIHTNSCTFSYNHVLVF